MRILFFALFVFSVSLNAGELEGDQHVAALTQEFDTLTTTYTLFARIVEEQRPVEVVAWDNFIQGARTDRLLFVRPCHHDSRNPIDALDSYKVEYIHPTLESRWEVWCLNL